MVSREAGAESAADVVVVGAGAAGLMAALAARGAVDASGGEVAVPRDAPRVVLLDAAPKVGLKILVSGGGRCNVTNEVVDETDFDCGSPHLLRGVLRAFPPASVRRFFESRGCPLYAEPLGKLFPQTDRAADVLGVLLGAVSRAGIALASGADVVEVAPGERGAPWRVALRSGATWRAPAVCLATGGKSLPKTGSRGFGLECAAALGHALETPLPALAPLRLSPDGPLAGLAGVTLPALLSLVSRGTPAEQVCGARFRPLGRAAGSLLVTHHGASGPAPLDVSGACGLALHRGTGAVLLADFWTLLRDDSPYRTYRDLPKAPGACLPPRLRVRPVAFDAFLAEWRARATGTGRALLTELGARLPRSLAERLVALAGLDPAQPAAGLQDGAWRRVHGAVTQCDLGLAGTGGYDKAEVTRGGVPLAELHRGTLESRLCPGLWLCGEVVDATGRLGGFNFQWAWASGFAAGTAMSRRHRSPQPCLSG